MFDIGPEKLLFIFGAVLLFLGPKELPAAARTIGKLRRQMRNLQDTVRTELSSAFELPRGSDEQPGPRPEPPSDRA